MSTANAPTADSQTELTSALETVADLSKKVEDLEAQCRAHAQTAADFELMLNQLVHATRSIIDRRVSAARDRAMDLVRRKGTSRPLRSVD